MISKDFKSFLSESGETQQGKERIFVEFENETKTLYTQDYQAFIGKKRAAVPDIS